MLLRHIHIGILEITNILWDLAWCLNNNVLSDVFIKLIEFTHLRSNNWSDNLFAIIVIVVIDSIIVVEEVIGGMLWHLLITSNWAFIVKLRSILIPLLTSIKLLIVFLHGTLIFKESLMKWISLLLKNVLLMWLSNSLLWLKEIRTTLCLFLAREEWLVLRVEIKGTVNGVMILK